MSACLPAGAAPGRARFHRRAATLLVLVLALAGLGTPARARRIRRLDIERYARLREAERYQIDVADKLFERQKWEAALREYEKYLRLYGVESVGTPYAQLRIAQCHANARRLNQAIREYAALLKVFPKSPEAPEASYAMGRCHMAVGEPKKAVAQYEATVATYPKSPRAGDALWELAALQKDRRVAYWARIVDDYRDSRHRLDAARRLVDHYLFAEKNVGAARAVYVKVRGGAETERYLAGRCHEHARWLYHYHKDKRKEALEWMKRAAALYEALPGKFPRSRYAREAERMIPVLYQDCGQSDKAVKAYRDYLKTHPDDDGERRNFGRMLERLGRWDDARAEYRRFKDAAAGAFEAAQSFHRQRRVKEAEAAYMAVVEKHPNYAKTALYHLGELHVYVSGDYAKAITAYNRSEYNPPQYLFRVGYAYERWGKFTEAINTYRQIQNFFKNDKPEAMWREALALERRKQKGDVNAAIRRLKALCDQFPRHRRSSDAHQRLEHQYHIPYTGGGAK